MGNSAENPFSTDSERLRGLKLTSLTGGYLFGETETIRTYTSDCPDYFISKYSQNYYWGYLMPTDENDSTCIGFKPPTTTVFAYGAVGS